jgi:hypothetical protein
MESCKPQRQDVENARRLPAHARPLETTVNDRLARPLHGTGSYGKPTVPGLLIPDTGPVPLHIADQLGQGGADGLFPGPHPLECTHDGPDAVRQERPHVLVNPGLSPRGIVGVLEVGKGLEVLAEMIVVQCLT